MPGARRPRSLPTPEGGCSRDAVWCGVWPLPGDATPSTEQEEKPRGGREWLVWVSVAPYALVMQKGRAIALRILEWMWITHAEAWLLPKAEGPR